MGKNPSHSGIQRSGLEGSRIGGIVACYAATLLQNGGRWNYPSKGVQSKDALAKVNAGALGNYVTDIAARAQEKKERVHLTGTTSSKPV
jgi:hypothetical protein